MYFISHGESQPIATTALTLTAAKRVAVRACRSVDGRQVVRVLVLDEESAGYVSLTERWYDPTRLAMVRRPWSDHWLDWPEEL